MEIVFWICVKIMVQLSSLLGISYQQLNVLLFVFLHPLITIIIFFKFKKYKLLYLQSQQNNKK